MVWISEHGCADEQESGIVSKHYPNLIAKTKAAFSPPSPSVRCTMLLTFIVIICVPYLELSCVDLLACYMFVYYHFDQSVLIFDWVLFLFGCYYLLAYVGMLGGLYVYYYFIITY